MYQKHPEVSIATLCDAEQTAAVANLAPAAADGVAEVAGDDQREIDKLVGLQNYVRALQEQGFIERGDTEGASTGSR